MRIKEDTIARTIILALALANQILAICGKGTLNFTEDQIYQYVSLTVTIVTSVVAWWKNNSFTQAALRGDELMHELKGAKK